MTNQQFSSVWDAIENTPEEAENMKLRSSLMIALRKHIERSGMSQTQTAKLLGVTQPRVSDLMRGKSTCSRWMRSSIWSQPPACTLKCG
jgi:predicted XRE-type DNA-binding protein